MKIDLSKKTVINIDETWLGMSDFRYMKWKAPGKPNSVPKKMIAPRISMILGLDSNGSMIMSLLQCNTNSEMMELFFSHFVKMMDNKRVGWRKDTVILLDGAAYHQSKNMMDFYERQ